MKYDFPLELLLITSFIFILSCLSQITRSRLLERHKQRQKVVVGAIMKYMIRQR